MVRTLAVAVVCLAGAAPAVAGAKGTFTNDGVTYTVVDAVAYERKAEFGDATAIRVALSHVPLDAKAIAAVLDVEAAVDEQRGRNPFVDLEVGMDGSWGGTTYTLGSGNGCGWCSYGGTGTSTLRIDKGMLRGTLKVAQKEYSDGDGPAIDVTLDLPVLKPAGTPLPAGGGEPGKALLACREIVKTRDMAGAKADCFDLTEPLNARVAEATDQGFFWSMALAYGRDSLEMPTLTITGGRAKGDWAEVLVEGKNASGQAQKGGVFLRKLPGGWRYHHEKVETVY